MILTQSNWLKMPARELGTSFQAPNGTHVGTPFELFKRHKTLPHPRGNWEAEYSRPRNLAIDTGVTSIPSSDTSSPRTLKHSFRRIGAPGLPPTPPTHSRSGSHQSVLSTPNLDQAIRGSSEVTSAPSTPINNHNSPPTPDVTPPRAMPPLAFRPPASDRYPSSRTDSFKTARETPYSSDDDEVSTVRPGLRSTRVSESRVLQIPEKAERRREVGLGLGLESDAGTTTPRPNTDSQREFVIFDGEWGSAGEDVSEVEREWDDNLMRNVTVRKRPAKTPYKSTDGPANEVLEDDIVLPTNATKVVRGLPLHERAMNNRARGHAEPREEPIARSTPMHSQESPISDIRRFSTMSGRSLTSTVIEAMVVEAPPIRTKTLRHTKKQLGLRDFNSDQSTRTSAQSSVISELQQGKSARTKSKHPERTHRSLVSNATISSTSSAKSRREVLSSGGIPVVVIPDRRSSTKSTRTPSLRSTSSRKTRRSMSLSSAPLSQSSKFNDPGYVGTFSLKKHALSDSGGSGHSVRTIDFPPNIPTRRSSLSAPTSRNTSRAGSLTAESLKAHDWIQEQRKDRFQSETIHRLQFVERRTDSVHHTRLNVDHNGDPFFGNRPSAQVTPFSQISYETAGTAGEVSEAMAVSIFPHQNKSVLVVQHETSSQTSPATLEGTDDSHLKSTNRKKASVVPVTPPQPSHPMDEVDSPLRNPRVPPEPPAIKFIPPTPAVLTPNEQEDDRQLGHGNEQPAILESRPKRGLSLMRRAFSNRRRNSEPSVQPADGHLRRTFSLTGRRNESIQTSKGTANPSALYPSVADRPADISKLHPFWRPAHFWDDLEDQDDYENDFGGSYPRIDNRPAPPKRSLSGKLKRTFAILPITDDDYDHVKIERRTVRRTASGNMRVVKKRSQSSLYRGDAAERRSHGSSWPAEEGFGHGFKDGNGGHLHTIPGLGVRVEYIGWGGMKRKLSERRRQQRSDRLRASISSPHGVRSGVDDVLRRKSQA